MSGEALRSTGGDLGAGNRASCEGLALPTTREEVGSGIGVGSVRGLDRHRDGGEAGVETVSATRAEPFCLAGLSPAGSMTIKGINKGIGSTSVSLRVAQIDKQLPGFCFRGPVRPPAFYQSMTPSGFQSHFRESQAEGRANEALYMLNAPRTLRAFSLGDSLGTEPVPAFYRS